MTVWPWAAASAKMADSAACWPGLVAISGSQMPQLVVRTWALSSVTIFS